MYELTPEQRTLQTQARELAQSVFASTAVQTDLTEQYPWDNVAQLRDAGFMGMMLPTSVGGRGLSTLDTVIVIEEMAKACATMGRITVDSNLGAIGAITKYGSEEQIKLAADLVLAGDKPAICISEPNAGSAASEMTTRADKNGDHYILNGEKYWITGGGVSKLHLIFARVFDDGVEQGIGAFITVLDDHGPEGLKVGRRLYAMGVRGIPETHLEFHDLKIHKSMMITFPDGLKRGFAALMSAYNAQRVGAGAVALGIAQCAFEEGVAYLKRREQFGRPLAEFQGLQWMVADMSVQLEAARLMLRSAAVSGETFPDINKAAQAKIFAAETANKVTNDALQFFGSSGYGRHNPMERHVRDARMFTIAGGTAQILRTQVASKILDMKLPQTRDGYLKAAQNSKR
ncbi:3-sulfinopropanoyl-CoA desulfinase [Advenella mimigardefordensis]|uniref:3-sulfinopropanoyl-CoA desulfinase n=1 Tax=Advenella mimigardefordensis (strain DSM 17166 / LMG 22922 / DPN7) TaxID=1247726 RepID=SPCAD_ADVMD|nr:3-sulfinopropanoyl-CoA desulfinase [Advenella mimigardefordensis]K4L7X3.1 RecName: Full=3-sulfinopropanoyl-CoA desulfinase; AltName: Full=3-sulfinopropionyl coenzyme A desulfinase; Short=3-sulfinopropionyl-CoA desulfinase; Short=3SP-CoA desulfinase [Advenella mimigardefordensis DPN7]5AF7_A Chain A, ACYL-COA DEHYDROGENASE [Advenella mimigardefordensis DPN7]5AF7_B Chain B, ACYL-COA DEHYDROGENASE [Advenella mimigardefordensis DPN7]5AHS_A Chain A, ACYL-COA DEHYDROGENASE [Advenella mimigardeforde